MTQRELLKKIKNIEKELLRRKSDCKLDYYNTGDVKHEKQLLSSHYPAAVHKICVPLPHAPTG